MKKKRITLMVVAAMAILMLPTSGLNAQEGYQGLFNRGAGDEVFEDGIMQRGNRSTISDNGLFTNANFGEVEAPLGSGIAVLLAAGLGYAALKRKEEKQ